MDKEKLIHQLEEKIKELEFQNQILREKQENRLKKTKARLQAITENVPGVVFQFYARNDGELGVYYTSPKLYEMFGLKFVKHSPQFLQEFITNIHEDDRQSWILSVQDVVQKKIPWKWKGRYVKPSGKIMWFEGLSVPTIREDEIVFDGIFLDITKKKEQETQRLEITRQQEELKKLDSLKRMAGAIAHRFNNAMMAVQGNLEILSINLPKDSAELKMVTNATHAAKGASRVGSMMLSYVGQSPLNLRLVAFADLVREGVMSLKDTLHCSIDQQQIKEVIFNVLSNAVESLPQGSGTVKITFGSDYFKTNVFPIIFRDDELKDGMYNYCQIHDNGHGISAVDLLRIFEPFYTTKFMGRGLGLALAAGIIKSHHGAFTVESSQEYGTTVRVLLPAISPVSQQVETLLKAAKDENKCLSSDILFVDDEFLVLMVGQMILEELGFTVHTATNGQEAVDLVSKQDIQFCAVVMDISMPEMNGIEAMKAIREVTTTFPVLLCSGYSEGDLSIKNNPGNEPDGFVAKPFDLIDMRKSLEKVLV